MQIPLNFNPRWYQQEALEALENGAKMAVWCWARRGGKDFTAFAYAVKKMIETPMNVVLVFPEKEQGKEAFWDNVENDGFKTIDHIPKSFVVSQDNTKMKLTLINGSTFSVLGSKNPDALRGANGKLYIFSEFVDIASKALDVIRPIVAVNKGQIILQSTPKIDGISGLTFKLLFDKAKRKADQFASRITADEYLDDETLQDLEEECIERNGNNFFYRQEFMCDWGQASATSYYGQPLRMLEKNKGIGEFPYNRAYPVYTAWDLGMSDSTAITFFQYYMVNNKPQIRIIDYHETNNIGLKPIIAYVMSKPYNIAWNFLPHDGTVRDSDAVQRIEKIIEYGLVNSSTLQREPTEDGIARVVEALPKVLVNEATTGKLIRKLRIYKRKWNPLTGDYIGPEHKTESHAADSIRYLFVAIQQEFIEKTCELYCSQADEDYEQELVSTNLYCPA